MKTCSVWDRRPLLWAFHRITGCPFCMLAMPAYAIALSTTPGIGWLSRSRQASNGTCASASIVSVARASTSEHRSRRGRNALQRTGSDPPQGQLRDAQRSVSAERRRGTDSPGSTRAEKRRLRHHGVNSRTRAGVRLAACERVPSSPLSFPPQQYALPSVATPQV
jgi:hypothetical protein